MKDQDQTLISRHHEYRFLRYGDLPAQEELNIVTWICTACVQITSPRRTGTRNTLSSNL